MTDATDNTTVRNVAHKHHYVPQFYLAAFTASGQKDGRLAVLDQRKLTRWTTTPRNCAFERDLYAVPDTVPNQPDAVEKAFAKLETHFAPVVAEVIKNRVMPSGEQLNVLMNFVTLTAVRVPNVRNQVNALSDKILKHELRQQISDPKEWESFRAAIPAHKDGSAITEEGFKKFIDGNDYTISLGPTWYVQMMLAGSDAILNALVQRYWTVLSVVEGAPDLICSDNPVCVSWNANASGPVGTGFGVPGTTLTLPLHRRVAMLATFEPHPPAASIELRGVATINAATARNATQLYSAEEEFVWLDKDGNVYGASDLLVRLRQKMGPSQSQKSSSP